MTGHRPAGRRIAPAGPVAHHGGRSTVVAIGVVALAAALLVAAGLRLPATISTRRAPATAAISALAQACPVIAGSGRTSIATGSVALAGAPVRGEGGSTATTMPGGREVDDLAVDSVGPWAQHDVVEGRTSAVVLSSSGSLAPGHVAYTATRTANALGGGLAVAACAETTDDSWFVGVSGTAEDQSTLLLTNVSDSPAVARVRVYGDRGALDPAAGRGIVVGPGRSKTVRVEDLVAGQSDLALRVAVLRGALTSAVFDASTSATPTGSDWVGAAAAPAIDQVVPGVVPGTRDRRLLLVNPGNRTALVSVRVSGADATFAAKGLDTTTVRPQSVAAVDLPKNVGDDAAALVVSSDVPVTGTLDQVARGGDTATAVASTAVTSTAAVPITIGPILKGARTTLLLTAAPGAAQSRVAVTAHDETGDTRGRSTVTVRPGTTTAVDPAKDTALARAGKQVAYLTVKPKDAPVLAVAAYEQGAHLAVLPVTEAPATVRAPTVTDAD